MTTAISTSPDSKTIRLHDGRVLGYVEYGYPAGRTVFYFHGHPGSRYEARFLASEAAQAGVRLIGVDRPGLGLSSYKAGRRLLDWPDDVSELADGLGIDRFAVMGFSGGGPYALACAYRLAYRLSACGIIAGVGRLDPLLSVLSQWLPWLLLPLTKRFFQDEERARRSLTRFAGNWVEPDRESLDRPGIKEILASSLVEAMRQGTRGAAYDGAVLGRRWGLNLKDVTFPGMFLWHGGLDKDVPITTGREVAERLPQCQATYYPREGHISLIVNHAAEIVSAVSA